MAQKKFPLRAETIGIGLAFGDFLPALQKIDGLRHVRIPDWLWRRDTRLHPAIRQAAYGRTVGTIHMESHQIIAPHPRGPG